MFQGRFKKTRIPANFWLPKRNTFQQTQTNDNKQIRDTIQELESELNLEEELDGSNSKNLLSSLNQDSRGNGNGQVFSLSNLDDDIQRTLELYNQK